jgi:prenyltransferase beta subunit
MRLPLRLSLLVLGCALMYGPVRADSPVGQQQTIDYLRKLQSADGSFISEAPEGEKRPAPTLRATSAAVRTLQYLGSKVPNAEGAAKFVAACHDAQSGGFADVPKGKPDVTLTAIGLMAVAALQMPAEKYVPAGLAYLDQHAKTFEEVRLAAAAQEAVKKRSPKTAAWLKQVQDTANFDGSYGKGAGQPRATGSAIAAILRLGGTLVGEGLDFALTVINDGQRDSGGWGKGDDPNVADLESTYRVMRALYMLKRPPAGLEAVRSFVAKCRNEDGGYGVAPGQNSSVSGTYYAAIITYWIEAMEKK